MVRDIWALGVNRLSIGVQSFDDACAAASWGALMMRNGAKRRHRMRARNRFENVSVDLMCGIPGRQHPRRRSRTACATAVRLRRHPRQRVPPHHRAAHALRRGMVLVPASMHEPDDDVEAAHMQVAERILARGWASSATKWPAMRRPGFECRHNIGVLDGRAVSGPGTHAPPRMTQNAERRMRVQDGRVTDDLDAAGNGG